MADFSKPQGKKFPEPVPVSQLDEARRAEYADLEPDIKKPVVPISPEAVNLGNVVPDSGVVASPPAESVPIPVVEEVVRLNSEGITLNFKNGLLASVENNAEYVPEVTDDEKRDFVRSLLGETPYRKVYNMFGAFEITFRDRSVKGSEDMYEAISQCGRDKKINLQNENEASLWVRRFQMAETLVSIKQADGTVVLSFENITPASRLERVLTVMQLSRPLYQAVYDTAIEFEQHIDLLTRKADEPDFWKAGGTS